MKKSDVALSEAVLELRKILKPGQTVYTILRHVSASGMSRVIDLVIVVPDYESIYPEKPEAEQSYAGERDFAAKPRRKLRGHKIRSIGFTAAKAMERTWDRDQQGIKIGGAGMDMGFEAVYSLGYALWPKGVRKGYAGKPEKDGGYALRQVWL